MIKNLFLIFLAGIGIAMVFRACCVLEQSREALNWPQTTGSVISSELTVDYLPQYNDLMNPTARWYGTQVKYQYTVGGQDYTSDQLSFQKAYMKSSQEALSVMNKYRREPKVSVYYDPRDPQDSVLQPGYIGDVLVQFFVGVFFAFIGILFLYPRTLEYNSAAGDSIGRGNVLQNRWKFQEALAEYNQFIKINPYLSLGYISRGNLFLQQKGAFQKFSSFDAGSTALSELIKNGILEEVPAKELPLGFYEFRAEEFGGSIERMGPLLVKLSSPKVNFSNITRALAWLNSCIEPYKLYVIYIKANGVSEGMRNFVPSSFMTLTDEELAELALTIKGRELKRSVLELLFPREAPRRLRINPRINLKENTVREIAKDEFDRVWAVLQLSQESWVLAIADFNKAITIDPKNAQVYFSLAKAYLGMNDFDRAWENLNKAREMGIDISPAVLDDIHKRFGR